MTTAQSIRLDQLDARLRTVWMRGQVLHLVAGLLASFRWAVPLFLIGVWIDWMTYMPAPGRVVMLIALLAVSLHRGWRSGWRHLRPFNARRTALRLEAHHGDLDSLLISALQFRNRSADEPGSDALRARACRQAEEAAGTIRPEQTVPYRALRGPGMAALMLAGAIAVFAVANGPFLAAGLMRIFCPWLAVEYPTDTQITLVQDQLVVKEGGRATIEASLHGVIPDSATIDVRTGEGAMREIALEVTDAACTYTISSASRDFSYRIKAGDDRTDWYNVRVIRAPRVERVAVGLTFPEYLGRQPQTVEALTLNVPEATKVNWRVTVDRPIRAAQFIREGEAPLDLPVSEDGRQVAFAEDVTASRGYSFSWVDREHGFQFTSPRYYLQVSSDQPPRVELTTPDANLVALIGRPINMTVRVQDDHGIGSTSVVYRVNQRDEAVVELKVPARIGQGDQPIDWDYRTVLPDLEVGDSVSFALQVSDRYPGAQGPHTGRSETRRVMFLTKEAYLEQVAKKKDRLLARVQTLYRQQRGAHEAVRNLDPDHDGYVQNCQMEAIRQELLRDQLKDVAAKLHALFDDLAANNVSNAAEGASLERIRVALIDIADTPIAQAASLLRDQSGAGSDNGQTARSPLRAAGMVNTAARELASLVLLRSIDSAQEVYARETRMLAQVQASVRWRTIDGSAGEGLDALLSEQAQIAKWIDRLTTDLESGMRYDKRPLAVLRLIRSVKDLREAEPQARISEAVALMRDSKASEAASIQAGLAKTFLDAEFSVRLSGAYSTLMRTRAQLRVLSTSHTQLRKQVEGHSDEALEKRQSSFAKAQALLRRELLNMLLPTIPGPRASLFDQAVPQAPPVDAVLREADHAMAQALQQLTDGDTDAATNHQLATEKAIGDLLNIVDRWSVELGLQAQGLGTLVAATSERMATIEEYEARAIALLEKMDIATSENKRVDGLTKSQSLLAGDLSAFKSDLLKQHRAEPDQDIPPLVNKLELAERVLNDATRALERNSAEAAIEQQERAADALAEAYAAVVAQNERLTLLQDLMMFQRSVGFANKYMADIVAEQWDLIKATESADAKTTPALMPRFGNLRQCLEDVAPLLDLVAARLDVGTPLAFSKADLSDAVASLEAGDKLDAVDAQTAAAESLEQVQQRVKAVQTQTGYVVEIVEFLHQSVAQAAILEYRQAELKRKAQTADRDQRKALSEEQRAMLTLAQAYGKAVETATGMPEFTTHAKSMRDALGRLEAADAAGAVEPMQQAQTALTENAESLFAVITMLHGLPSIEVTTQTEPALVRLVDVLALASAHKQVFRQTDGAQGKAAEALAKLQRELDSRLKQIIEKGQPHPMLVDASRHVAAAASAFESSDRQQVRRDQKAADDKLRHFIIEQALILETAKPPAVASDGDPVADGEGSDSEAAFAAGFISDFVSGQTPKDKRTEWKVLADRNRAALNQNFARELPLEYRGMLKDYYERVAK